jgi:uncharacterized membrane protein YqjE
MRENEHAVPKRPFDRARLMRTVALRFVLSLLILGFILFWPSGTFRYWQAWTYICILFIPMLAVGVYFLRKDPELLERRMRTKEKEKK